MKLIFLYGMPATGKLTVARELASLTGFRLFHNHLTVDLLLSVFDFGSQLFIELRERIWLSVIEGAAHTHLHGLIFTFAPESTVRAHFLEDLQRLADTTGIELHFIELTCPTAELKSRLDTPSRRQYQKLTSHALFDDLLSSGSFAPFPMPTPELTLDTSQLTPIEAAHKIIASLG